MRNVQFIFKFLLKLTEECKIKRDSFFLYDSYILYKTIRKLLIVFYSLKKKVKLYSEKNTLLILEIYTYEDILT